MLTLVLPANIQSTIVSALIKHGRREVGGVLMGAHVGLNKYEVQEVTVQKQGSIASFVRHMGEALWTLHRFFSHTRNQYTRYNYIGEWHSHPLFNPEPSSADDSSVHQIVNDPAVGANFVVLLVVKLNNSNALELSAHTYLPGGVKQRSQVYLSPS